MPWRHRAIVTLSGIIVAKAVYAEKGRVYKVDLGLVEDQVCNTKSAGLRGTICKGVVWEEDQYKFDPPQYKACQQRAWPHTTCNLLGEVWH